MTAKDAYIVLKNTKPNYEATRCVEYKMIYVFQINNGRTDGSLCSVHKLTGKVKGFTPFDISVEEYRAGKEIKNFH